MQKETEIGGMTKAFEGAKKVCPPKDSRSDARSDFENLSKNLVKPNEDEERVEIEEWEKGNGNPPFLKEFTVK